MTDLARDVEYRLLVDRDQLAIEVNGFRYSLEMLGNPASLFGKVGEQLEVIALDKPAVTLRRVNPVPTWPAPTLVATAAPAAVPAQLSAFDAAELYASDDGETELAALVLEQDMGTCPSRTLGHDGREPHPKCIWGGWQPGEAHP